MLILHEIQIKELHNSLANASYIYYIIIYTTERASQLADARGPLSLTGDDSRTVRDCHSAQCINAPDASPIRTVVDIYINED